MVVAWHVALVPLLALLLVSSYLTLYNLAIGLFGLPRRRQPPAAGQLPLLVVIPAHNEERVIAGAVRSVAACDYPRDLVTVLVLADHCTDGTALAARDAGADRVWVRETGPGGKQHAITALLDALGASGELDAWSGVLVVDSDNLVHPGLLQALSDHLAAGAWAVQAALDTRNPETGWVSRSYAAAYWVANLMVQRSRARLRLSAQLGGTGMAIATATLRRIPFRPTSLVDDLEYTLQIVLAGGRVDYCEAPVYDEKPITLRASIRQRTRWMRGQAQVIRRFAVPLFGAALRGNWPAADQFVMLWNPIAMAVTCGYFLLVLPFMGRGALEFWLAWNLGINLMFLIAARVPWTLWINAVWSLLYSFTWIPPVVWGFCTSRRTAWTHTEHVGAGMAAPGGVMS